MTRRGWRRRTLHERGALTKLGQQGGATFVHSAASVQRVVNTLYQRPRTVLTTREEYILPDHNDSCFNLQHQK